MDAELLGAQRHQLGVGLGHLVLAHAVLGIAGIIHDAISQVEHAARIVPAADGFGNTRHLFEEVHMGEIIQIDVGTQFIRFLHILRRRIVGREHNVTAGKAASFAHQQLGIAGAIDAAAFLLQNFEDVRVRRGLYGEIFFKALVPAESRIHAACIFSDSFFVIEMERRGHIRDDLLCLFQRNKRQLLRHFSVPFRLSLDCFRMVLL